MQEEIDFARPTSLTSGPGYSLVELEINEVWHVFALLLADPVNGQVLAPTRAPTENSSMWRK